MGDIIYYANQHIQAVIDVIVGIWIWEKVVNNGKI